MGPRGATGSRPPGRGPVAPASTSSRVLRLVFSAEPVGFWQPFISKAMERTAKLWAILPRSFTLARHENRAYKALSGLSLNLSPLNHLNRANRTYGAFPGLFIILPRPSTDDFLGRVALQEKSRATEASSKWGEETRTIFLSFPGSEVYALLSRAVLMGAPFCYLHSNTVTKSGRGDFYTEIVVFARILISYFEAWIRRYFHSGVRIRVRM